VTVIFPAIAELTSWETCVPRSGNSGMSTNWMPGAGRGWTPGLFGSAPRIAWSVGWANADASCRYAGFSYVEARLPAGTLDQPSLEPTSSSYCLLEAQEMNCHALFFLALACWMLQDQA